MPELPSGLKLALTRHALFDHGGNWFHCPDGHFWYWDVGPEMNLPPFDLSGEVLQEARHAPVPVTREEVKRYIRVYEMRDDGIYVWRGEWLSGFPQYTELDERDLQAWRSWLNQPKTDKFLDETIEECRRLAEASRHAVGRAMFKKGQPDQSMGEGWVSATLKAPS
jgi:hypothetical protein